MSDARNTSMTINYDILLNILDLSEDLADFGQLMRTCWTLYEAAVPRLLRRLRGRVSIFSRHRMVSFCAFMLRKRPSRFQHLVELDIQLERPFYQGSRVIKLLALMFKGAAQLTTLKLSNPHRLLVDKAIPRAIASLSSLREIILRDMCDEVIPTLEKTKSPIRRVNISFDPEWAEDGGDPIPLLKHLTGSIQELDVSWVNFETLGIQYPHLVILRLDICVGFDFETLYTTFPNLRHLSLYTGIEHEWTDPRRADWQRQHNSLGQANLGTWQSLSYVRSCITTLYSLALRCRVDHLDMRQSGLVPECRDWLRAVLYDVRPLAVSLDISAKEFDTSLLGEALSPSVYTLRELFLQLDFCGAEYVDPSPTLRTMLGTLSQHSIRLLHMSMEWSYSPASPIFDFHVNSDDPEGVIMEPHAHVRLENTLNTLDIAALVEDVSRLIPSLQYICLSTSYGFLDAPVWEVRRDVPEDQPGARRVLRLSRADGKRILKESILHRPAPEVEL